MYLWQSVGPEGCRIVLVLLGGSLVEGATVQTKPMVEELLNEHDFRHIPVENWHYFLGFVRTNLA